MAKFGLFIQVICLIILTSEIRAVSVAEILFSTLSDRLDTLTERFDKLEEIVRTHEHHSAIDEDQFVQENGQDESDYNDIRNTKTMLMKAMSTEKQNLRHFVRDFEKQFDEFKQTIQDSVAAVNETVTQSNENMASNMAHNRNSINEQFIDVLLKINEVDDKITSKESDDIVSEVHSMEDRIATIEDDQIFREEQMKSMNTSITLFNNFANESLYGLAEQITTVHARKVAFTVTFSSTRQLNVDDILIFDHEVYHYGNSYSTSTGKFTAPISGTYLFTISVEGTHNKPAIAYLTDDRLLRMSAVSYKGEDVTGSNTCVFYMEEGTQAWVMSKENSEFFKFRTTFTGVLLG